MCYFCDNFPKITERKGPRFGYTTLRRYHFGAARFVVAPFFAWPFWSGCYFCDNFPKITECKGPRLGYTTLRRYHFGAARFVLAPFFAWPFWSGPFLQEFHENYFFFFRFFSFNFFRLLHFFF